MGGLAYGWVPGGQASMADIITGFAKEKADAATAQAQPALVNAQTAHQQAIADQEAVKAKLEQQRLKDAELMRQVYADYGRQQMTPPPTVGAPDATPPTASGATPTGGVPAIATPGIVPGPGGPPAAVVSRPRIPNPIDDPVGFAMHVARNNGSADLVNSLIKNGVDRKKEILAQKAEERAAKLAELQPVQDALLGYAQTPEDDPTREQKYQTTYGLIAKLDPQVAASLPQPTPGAAPQNDDIMHAIGVAHALDSFFSQNKTKQETATSLANQKRVEVEAANAQEEEKRKSGLYQSQLTGEQDKVRRQQIENAAPELANAVSKEDYARRRGTLPANVATAFPDANEFDPKTTPAKILQVGMKPNEAANTQRELDDLVEKIRHNKATESEERRFHTLTTEGIQLTPEATDKMAEMFATTGNLPPLGMGQAAGRMRSAIINRAQSLYPTVQFATQKAAYQANQSSLQNVTKTLDTLTAFENTGLRNLKTFTDLAAKLPDTGVPWLNTPLRALNEKAIGSENMAVVNAARQIALREIARVTNDPKLSGVLSDSARHEVMTLVPENATIKQILGVAKLLQGDMANVHGALDEQKNAITKRISEGVSEAIPAKAVTPGVATKGGGKEADEATIKQFLEAAGGDKDKARKALTDSGWIIPKAK